MKRKERIGIVIGLIIAAITLFVAIMTLVKVNHAEYCTDIHNHIGIIDHLFSADTLKYCPDYAQTQEAIMNQYTLDKAKTAYANGDCKNAEQSLDKINLDNHCIRIYEQPFEISYWIKPLLITLVMISLMTIVALINILIHCHNR